MITGQPSKIEQIENILFKDSIELYKKYYRYDSKKTSEENDKEFEKIITITKQDIRDYIAKNPNFIEKHILNVPNDFSAEKIWTKGYRIFNKDLGHLLSIAEVDTDEELIEKYINYVVMGEGLSKVIK